MSFDDLTRRIGNRHGVSPALLADPAALARKAERDAALGMLVGGLALVGIVVALALALATAGWWMPGVTGTLVLGGGVAIARGVHGLRKLRR